MDMIKKVDSNDVTIISVTYNSAHCLPALSEALKTHKNVVIVDNASDDDSQYHSSADHRYSHD